MLPVFSASGCRISEIKKIEIGIAEPTIVHESLIVNGIKALREMLESAMPFR